MIFAFGDFHLDLDRRELRRISRLCPLERKAFNVLVYLLKERHRVVSKDELLETCWPGEFVTEAALNRCLGIIRRAVGDDGVRQEVIRTVRGYGFRFVAAVETRASDTAMAVVPAISPPSHDVVPPLQVHGAPADPTPARVSGVPPLPSGPRPMPAVTLPCPQCQTTNRAARQFCARCGHELWRLCPHCGFGNAPGEHFCGGCGQDATAIPVASGVRTGPPLAYTPAHLVTKILTVPQTLVGERKPVTVLVADIEGLHELLQAGSADEMDETLNRGFALAVAEIHRVEGFVSQVTRAGFVALFGVPLAYEDHVLRALHAALGVQHVFAAYAAKLWRAYGVLLTLRLGVHTGPIVVGTISQDLRLAYTTPGVTLQLATGLGHLAHANTVVVSETVQQHATGFFHFDDLGTHRLPEVTASLRVYACTGRAQRASRLEVALARRRTVFQGRTQEMALIEACWARACRSEGQVLCLVGEAGIGKSRLAYEYQQRLHTGHLLTTQALSYGDAIPYHAFLPLLRTLLGVITTDLPAQQWQALHTRLASLPPALAADAPLLAHLLGIPLDAESLPPLTPDAQRRRVQQACFQLLVQQAAHAPLCLLVEDAHWLDPSSQELLDLLVASLARRPILVLCTARPGFHHLWTDHSSFHQVAIAPLTAVETDALIRDTFQPYDATVALKALIRARTGGNPFFVEEFVQALLEQDLLVRQDGVYAIAAETHVTLPASLQGVVQARLDRLPAAEKRVVQIAAVIGPQVPFPLLHALVADAEEMLQRHLVHLQTGDFLYEAPTIPGPTYTFKHALVQDAAYQSLLQDARQQWHQRIAQILEERFPETVETQPEVVAQHYSAAGLPGRAMAYWQAAGQRAMARSAYVEAIVHLRAGIAALETLPETPEHTQQALALHIALGAPLVATQGYAAPEVERVYARARSLCQRLGDTLQLFPVLRGLALFYLVRAEFHTTRELGAYLLTLAEREHDTSLLLEAHFTLGIPLFYLGDLVATRAHMEHGIGLYDPQQHRAHAALYGQDTGDACLGFTAWALGLLGYPEQALQRANEALALAQELAHPYTLAWAMNFATIVHHLRRDPLRTRVQAEALIALASEQGFPFWVAAGMCFRGSALMEEGQEEEGMTQIRQGMLLWQTTGAELARPLFLSMQAAAYGKAGQPTAGLLVLAEALALADSHGERFWEAELHRLKGELLLARPEISPPEAEACFHQALDVARRQQAKSLELRAALSLARLWQRQGKRAEAQPLLAAVYGWFTEGFDTADLQEARALLEELA